jgi:hypothetical protein
VPHSLSGSPWNPLKHVYGRRHLIHRYFTHRGNIFLIIIRPRDGIRSFKLIFIPHLCSHLIRRHLHESTGRPFARHGTAAVWHGRRTPPLYILRGQVSLCRSRVAAVSAPIPFLRSGVTHRRRCWFPRTVDPEAWETTTQRRCRPGRSPALKPMADPTVGALLRATSTLRGWFAAATLRLLRC